jgi:hypothetical protein
MSRDPLDFDLPTDGIWAHHTALLLIALVIAEVIAVAVIVIRFW